MASLSLFLPSSSSGGSSSQGNQMRSKWCSLQKTQIRLPPMRRTQRLQIRSVFPNEVSELPIPDSVTYKRSAIQTHYECSTSLENLGMKQFSSDLSKSLANSMGLLYKNSPTQTPVAVSFDVTKEKDTGDLKLNGIVKTAVCVLCDRCLSPHPTKIFSTFSLLLSRSPVEEPKELSIGVVFGEEAEEGEAVLDIDLDDKFYFPDDAKVMDISAYVRDTIHLEVPYFSICSSSCKGLCTSCGCNLNTSKCNCSADKKGSRVKFKTTV